MAALVGLLLAGPWTSAAFAQPPAESAAAPAEGEPLSSRQEAIALRYQRFETTLLQLAEYLRKTDPDRAELLVRALGRSKETRIPDQLRVIVDLLGKDQLGDAIDSQDHVIAQMQLVLLLLQSEDRQDELEKEKARIRDLIKGVDRIIAKETDVRSATERRSPADQLGTQQKKVGDDTQKLMEKIDAQDAERRAQQSGGQSPDQQKSSDKPSSEKPPGEKSSDDKPSAKPEDSQPKPGESGPKSKPEDGAKPGENSKPSPADSGKPSDKPQDSSENKPSKPSESQDGQPQPPQQGGQPSESGQQPPQGGEQSPQQQQQTPGRQELNRAKQEMERAIKELEQKQHGKASDRQDQALAELHKAKERLEEILRQLREEEKELMLAALEARFRDMLSRQINVHNGTVGLATVPEDQRVDKHRSRAIELARNQDEVALLAAKALTLLKEEGSSVAFPEAVMQIRDDMLTSARRLERVDVGELTQGIQRDIIESLEEILDALQKELEKSKDKKQQQQQQQQGQPQDQGLVDALAELKMLRSLQYRVNRRTKQIGRLVEGEQAVEPDLVQQLQQLSTRQAKIQQTAADLAAGRNK
jgi:hypothetical protein